MTLVSITGSPSQGILIACEGIDGSGKSTLARALHAFFSNQNIPSLLTKEPGGTPLGLQLRALVQNPAIKRCSKAEFLLFAADRAEHFNTVIVPALKNKSSSFQIAWLILHSFIKDLVEGLIYRRSSPSTHGQ